MNLSSLGDRAQSVFLKQQNAALKQEMQRLSREVTTGLQDDRTKAVGGDFTPLAGIERSIRTAESYNNVAKETAVFVQSAQAALETVQQLLIRAGTNLITVGSAGQPTIFQSSAADARQNMEAVVAAVNQTVGDRSVFAGMATGSPALASVDVMLADIATATAGATTAADIEAAVTDWFDAPGGGFETIGYLGSTNNLLPVEVGPGQSARMSAKADDQEIRDALKSFAMAAVMTAGAPTLSADEQRTLVMTAGTSLIAADKNLAIYRSDIGTAENQVANSLARNSAEITSLEIARAEILEADPFSAASDLTSAQSQLETLYALTSRLSRLSLVDFLR